MLPHAPCALTCALWLFAILSQAPNDPLEVIPNDPLFERQISLRNPGGEVCIDIDSRRPSPRSFSCEPGIDLNVTRAWALTTGSREVVVAVIDGGFFHQHEDLAGNIWTNPGESGLDERGFPKETNGIDDDGNGYVDDVTGYDFFFDDPDPDPYIYDGKLNSRIAPNWHAIDALGIIGARGDNGVGVAGVCWQVSLMLLKPSAQGTWPPEVERRGECYAAAIRYAADNGARIINWSGFLGGATPEEIELVSSAIEYAAEKDVLLVLGAGNGGRNLDELAEPLFPQCFGFDNALNVAEITFMGKLDEDSGKDRVSSSDWGPRSVAVAAIGRNYTTNVYNGRSTYVLGGGTSDAAPIVTGVAALMLSVNPQLGYRELKEILIRTARPLPTLEGKLVSGGMVDAYAAVRAVSK